MQILHAVLDLPKEATATCVTIGNFDGVHKGHQALISQTINQAQAQNLFSLCITFWPHPRSIVTPHKPHAPLSTRHKRFALLKDLGLCAVLELAFTKELASLSPDKFVCDYLVPLNTRLLLTGYDFCLGRNRSGHTEELRALGQQYGFLVEQLEPYYQDGSIVSSTRLRKLISAGYMREANALLGRPYTISGEIIHGDGRGQSLGFPTANLGAVKTLLPAPGVYLAYAMWEGHTQKALVNIGTNPTFGPHPLSIEAFILQQDLDIYGVNMELAILQRLRDECHFPNKEALIKQIHDDVAQAKRLFQNSNELEPFKIQAN
ncbi:MAG: bifunctional riboflavin kinase/FAD synthetase [Desulfovibrionaceae bacterium]|nr:bifunctional riboflavin kinase/FAD synthetase [Desulfovibrionaceae bacterium]